MKFNPGILRPYDIRGEYGKDFDDEFAKHLGAALVKYFGAKQLVVARDMRPSAVGLTNAVIEGITSMGCDVIDIGTASTPFFYYATIFGPAPAGIMVTASHMGPAFNGFKISKKDGMILAKDSGLNEVVEIIQKPAAQTAAKKGKVTSTNFLDQHADFLIEHAQLKKGDVPLKVAVEGESMIQNELKATFSKLGIAWVKEGYDIKFGFDADGDRLAVYNAHGKQIRGDLYAGVIGADLAHHQKHYLLNLSGGPTVVYDIRYSRGVIEYYKSKGMNIFPSKIGHTFIKRAMKEHEADFCGEGSGHMMFKEMKFSESTQLALLKLLKIITTEKKTIDQLIEPLDTWCYSNEVNIPVEGWPDSVPAILQSVKTKYSDGKIDEMDGIKVDYPDWWFLMRASANDPVIRIIVETKTKEMTEEKVEELKALITG